jgi:exopolysaccharide production protein ExoY
VTDLAALGEVGPCSPGGEPSDCLAGDGRDLCVVPDPEIVVLCPEPEISVVYHDVAPRPGPGRSSGLRRERLEVVRSDPAPLGARPRWERAAKRVLDVVLALVLIILTLPIMVVVALAVFVSDPGPVIFRQERVGRGGAPFRIAKFRTMIVGAEEHLRSDPVLYRRYLENDHKLPPALDPRITRAGHLLRATSLDELPQLFNVLAGSMSLVGPRPVIGTELGHYGHKVSTVLSVRPGMTGVWQVSGRCHIGYPERAELDLTYASAWSVGQDLRILAQTAGIVARRTGAG